ncbi:MAG: ornithine carbamoyltransferase [Candidatus Tectomicrobia bacterium]
MKRDFLSLADVTPAEIERLLVLANEFKQRHKSGAAPPYLAEKSLVLIFHKPSLRTRTSFEVGMYQLGGFTTTLQDQDIGIGVREPAKDLGRVLSRYYDGIVVRTFAHDLVVELAQVASIPVINGLTDLLHPCQILSALQALREHFGRLAGLHIAYVGDGNNMANSWLLGAAQMGLTLTLACPLAYRPDPAIVAQAYGIAETSGAVIEIVDDPKQAVKGVDVVYTDAWTSMGQEDEAEVRREVFQSYQINAALLAETPSHAVVMHCLPAHRGEEITEDVFEGSRSLVFEEAENRLHAQKALLVLLLNPEERLP